MQEVREIMSPKIVTIGEADHLLTAEDIMTLGEVRHMPVVKAGRLVGVVSQRDLLRASPSHLGGEDAEDLRAFLGAVEVGSVMSSPAVVIDPKSSVRDAARVMAENKIGCLPVMNGTGELLGMVTETDVLRAMADGG